MASDLMADGKTNSEIARELFISEDTVNGGDE
jgi:DNA-binding CsgD family transcriptional regulator